MRVVNGNVFFLCVFVFMFTRRTCEGKCVGIGRIVEHVSGKSPESSNKSFLRPQMCALVVFWPIHYGSDVNRYATRFV